jgi:hypothetical protein
MEKKKAAMDGKSFLKELLLFDNAKLNHSSEEDEIKVEAAENIVKLYFIKKDYVSAKKYIIFLLEYAAQKEADSDSEWDSSGNIIKYDDNGDVINKNKLIDHNKWTSVTWDSKTIFKDSLAKLKKCYIKLGKSESEAIKISEKIKRNAFSKENFYF